MALIALTSLAPQLVGTPGGEAMVASGVFPTGVPLTVHLGPAGDSTDAVCYSNREGYGYSPVSDDGTTVAFVSAPCEAGANKVTIYGGADDQWAAVTVVEPPTGTKQVEVSRSFPPDSIVRRGL